ncbi:MAG: hypothetical protein KDD48_06440 [Bdellovibrionales bacterium]|nr:hypothetical protein [Bdellovibrionales bacterium]
MKKLLTLVSAVAVAGVFTTASAIDRSGKFALGFQEQVSDGILDGSKNSLGSWSLKYGFSPSTTGQFIFGFDMGKEINKRYSFGARLLADIVENENSDFYSGVGILFDNQDEGNRDIRVSIPLGLEFSFSGLPEIGFSAEAGLVIDFAIDRPTGVDKPVQFSSVGGQIGGALGLGVHYYF